MEGWGGVVGVWCGMVGLLPALLKLEINFTAHPPADLTFDFMQPEQQVSRERHEKEALTWPLQPHGSKGPLCDVEEDRYPCPADYRDPNKAWDMNDNTAS